MPLGRCAWPLSMLGLFVVVFAVLALSGPGRLDILDGQARYEVARSLALYGDPVVRDPQLEWSVLPGRCGKNYSAYRLPQSLAGVPAVWLADLTGPADEGRRQFFFALTSPAAAALLAVCFALWFRAGSGSPAAAVVWSLGGVFCTPCWFYGTSVFDDILGTTAVVAALTLSRFGRSQRPRLFAALAGAAIGLAFNCKQPLGVFVLPVLADVVTSENDRRRLVQRVGLVLAGLALGLAVYRGYDFYKFPPGTTAGHARLLEQYVPAFPGNPLAGTAGLLLSPSASLLLYCPAVIPSLLGLAVTWRRRRLFVAATVLACLGFFGFVVSMVIFKGDPAWGPRYLTPVVAVLWLFAPASVRLWGRGRVAAYLAAGCVVQFLALSVDAQRLYIQRGLPSAFYYGRPWVYFDPQVSHLLNRPREMWEIVTAEPREAESFGPGRRPTEALPIIDFLPGGPEAVQKYHVLNSFRPWWASMSWLPPDRRPIDLPATAALLGGAALGGLALIAAGLRGGRLAPGRNAETTWEETANECVPAGGVGHL